MKLKKNLKKLTNKELIQSALKSIEDIGYHVQDVNTGNTYFVYQGEDDSICHFHIKEIPGFLFAFWVTGRFNKLEERVEWCNSLDIDTKSELIFFTQYERDLDKFKPSRSGFVMGIYRQAWEEENDKGEIVDIEDWSNFYEIDAILKYMKKHRIRSVEYAGCQTRYIWEDDRSGFRIFIQFIHDWCYEYKSRFKEWRKYKKAIRVSKKYMKKLKTFNYIIRDEGECVHPRIDIQVRRKDVITDEKQYDKDWDLIEWFDKKYYRILNINWRQYGGDTEEEIEKDMKERARFHWFCYQWINNKIDKELLDDSKLIDYSVEDVEDLDELIASVEKDINEKFEGDDDNESSNT